MIEYALHGSEYLDAAQYYHKIWETPSIKEDESKGRDVRLPNAPVLYRNIHCQNLGFRTCRVLRRTCTA